MAATAMLAWVAGSGVATLAEVADMMAVSFASGEKNDVYG
jgi:hypothetical protein